LVIAIAIPVFYDIVTILPSENPRIVKYLTRVKSIPLYHQEVFRKVSDIPHASQVYEAEPRVRYLSFLGFSDGRIAITAI
jgi:hypothetical protein